jgi:cellobiose-specific phosphotransferase system component IIB
MAEIPTHLDNLKHKKGLIDLESNSEGSFGLEDYSLSFVYDDIVLVELIDEITDEKGSALMRNGLYIPTNANTKAWRKGKVVLVGPHVEFTDVGDIVIFPNDKGATVANIDVVDYGIVKKGMFLNEQRLFGTCVNKNK